MRQNIMQDKEMVLQPSTSKYSARTELWTLVRAEAEETNVEVQGKLRSLAAAYNSGDLASYKKGRYDLQRTHKTGLKELKGQSGIQLSWL
ncbi:hypothetical protein MHYP_G00080840 [Metynnis hypsauchen]